MLSKKARLPIFLLFSGVVIISFSFYFYQVFFAANFLVGKDRPEYLEIRKGMRFKELTKTIQNQELASDIISFAFVSKVLDYQDHIKAGKYLIEANSNNIDIVRKLRSGIQQPVMVTFNNARTKKDLAEKICKYLEIEPDQLLAYMSDEEECEKYDKDTTSVINLFLPNSYEMYWNDDPDDVLSRMKKEYDRFWNDARLQKARELGLNQDEVNALASIVQAEARFNDEKPRIACVYLNILRKGIPLQADPTLVFALKKFDLKRVLNVHKEIESPYNTYKNKGLPPGPINVPSAASIDATLNAEAHSYMFFCAKEDFSGYHNFATTIREHINNANRYQRALNRANIR